MRISIIGTGYVGLVTGVCLSHLDHEVICVDNDQSKIDLLEQGIMPIYEKSLNELVADCIERKRLSFTTSLKDAINECSAVFICVGTPSLPDGNADLSYIFDVAKSITENASGDIVVVNKSTVPVGTADKVRKIIETINPNLKFDVISNPEFLREGIAINDFLNPDRIVVGTSSDLGFNIMQEIYKPLSSNGVPLIITDTRSAEMIKYATNAFLATKITFANDLADLCEKTGGNITEVTKGLGMDSRIGEKFLNPGPGFGGSCFPKDTRALVQTSDSFGVDMAIINTVIAVNEKRKIKMAQKIVDIMGDDIKGKNIAVLGVTFKAGTNDMREAPSLIILPKLVENGAIVSAFDPQGSSVAPDMLPSDISWPKDINSCCKNADAIVILTEWNEFSLLNFNELKTIVNKTVLIDLQNMYSPNDMEKTNFTYHSLGRKSVND